MVTTVKVRLRLSSVAGRAGTVCYRVSRGGKVQQIATQWKVLPEAWDEVSGRILIGGNSGLCELQRRIDGDVALLRRIVAVFESRGSDYAVGDVVACFRTPDRRIMLLGYMREQIALLDACGKLGTARNYRRTLNSISKFLHGTDLPLCLFDEQLVVAYAAWLQRRGILRNSLSFYMRVLRSVYNKAVRQRLVEQTFPFQSVYTGVDRTRKRAVGEEVLVRLKKLRLEHLPALAFARDLFVFSYCMRGMAFVDMAFLRKSDVRGGAIWYVRRKTSQQLIVRIEPCMQEIIDRYTLRSAGSPYLFPILSSHEPQRAYIQYQTALGAYNQRLKRLSELLGLGEKLSSYTSRHTWATAARNHNIPLPVISMGMGHASEKTTRIYLAALENSVIDEANQGLLASLNG